jgi:hypothetical protein
MRVVKLLSWHAQIAAKAASLRGNGITIDAVPLVRTSAVIGELARLNPAVLVLDLDRLPSNSREIALMLRASKSARHIPILLAGSEPSEDGPPDKYARLKSELPDVPYAAWLEARSEVAKLLGQPRSEPYTVPPPRVYKTSLSQKLGVLPSKTQSATKARQIALLGAPEGFVELLGDLPETVKFSSKLSASANLAICFIRSLDDDFSGTLDLLTFRLPQAASVWIAYPKRNSGSHRDFNENDLRQSALAAGFVTTRSVQSTRTGQR